MAKKSKVVQMSGSQPSAAAAAPKMQIDPFKLPTVTCPNCEGIFFDNLTMYKEVPALQSPNGQASMLPIPVVVCNECGTVHPKFTPREFFENGEEK
jgi:uncharacterized Zn finger protein